MIMEKKTQSSKETLVRSLGVFELRGLAREMGISSPTTKKREELISLILEKFDNGEPVENVSPRRGRPYKQLNTLSDIVGNFSREDQNFSQNSYESVLYLFQEEKPIILDYTDETGVFEGYVRSCNGDMLIFDYSQNEKVFLDKSQNFEEGTKIKVEACRISGSKHYGSSKILKIDGQKIEEYKDCSFERGDEILSQDYLKVLNSKAVVGRRNVFYYEEDLFENDMLENLIKECENKKQNVLLLSLNTPYENMLKYKSLKVNFDFVSEYASNATVSFNKLVDTINYASHLSEKGQNVVIFVPDILDISRKLDEILINEENTLMGHSQNTIIVLQKLFALGKAYENGGNITLLMGYNSTGKDDKFLTTEILRISKKIN